MRLLIAEDDAAIAEGLTRSLRDAGYAVEWAADGESAEAALQGGSFDVLILDLGLPKKSGLEVLKGLRARGSRLPVLILTAFASLDRRVDGLDAGADDYLGKPFEFAELEARVRALARRGAPEAAATLSLGSLVLDRTARLAHLDGRTLDLSARELMLLEVLLQRAGRLVSREQLRARIGEWGEDISGAAIDLYVERLRKRLEPEGFALVAVPGLGYSLDRAARKSGGT